MESLSPRSKELLSAVMADTEQIMSPYACRNNQFVRQYASWRYDDDVLRTQFAIDTDKILHSALYNRGSDKTQVFSFYRNDDITRRSSHVQLVSRISRIIGRALRLNTDLIEAIAVGHDVGHTPFGHKGEEFLNALYHAHTGRLFNHNVHSVRVLQQITNSNLTLQTLDGILCHCGEKAFSRYEPARMGTFDQFNDILERCYTEDGFIKTLRPSTLEGCVVRISDMIAYLGKDRQDAYKAGLGIHFEETPFGGGNADIITAVITDIVENSLEKPYISMSGDVFDGITRILRENGEKIYQRPDVNQPYYETIRPMMELMYEHFLGELQAGDTSSLVYRHFLDNSIVWNFYRDRSSAARRLRAGLDLNDIVTDFIASMTDDYFVDAFSHLFPGHPLAGQVRYVEYFDPRYM